MEVRHLILKVTDRVNFMIHRFSITTTTGEDEKGHQLRSHITVFQAETELGPTPQLDFPNTIKGKLTEGHTPEQLFQFGFKPGVEIGFEGKGYGFTSLDKDGTFELSIVRP
jgi:hypothetical protein